MLTRREFLKLGAAAGAGLFLPWTWDLQAVALASPNLTKFIDPLPIPGALTAASNPRYRGADYYEVAMTQFTQQLHSELPPTTLWGYGSAQAAHGSYPGPTIEARRGKMVVVKWINSLPTTHPLQAAIDPTIPYPPYSKLPNVRTVAHLHGGFTPPQFDGHPDAWFTPGNSRIFQYPNAQPATTLWYHDHGMGITRLNVYAGLAAFYLIRDTVDTAVPGQGLNIPKGAYEVPIVIQDRMFNPDGSLFYPTAGITAYHPIWVPEFFGDTPVVNGKAYPYLAVEPRRYRLRILNGSQARFYNLWFDGGQGPVPFYLIGTDGGLLPAPVRLSKILLAPAERADIIMEFAPGAVLTLMNNAKAPFPGGRGGMVNQIMQFRATKPLAGADTTTPPALLALPAFSRLTPTPGAPMREIVMRERMDPLTGNPIEVLLNGSHFMDPATESPKVGTTEIWQFINLTEDAHPMHVHLVQFQVLNRQPFDAEGYTEAWLAYKAGTGPKPVLEHYLTGPATPPPAEETGWKDTAKSFPGEVLRVIARFDIPPLTTLPAEYVYHCHILEHEDNEMMRPYKVMA